MRTFSPSRLRLERERAGLRSDQLAVAAGVSVVTVWRLQTDARAPSVNTVAALADALGIHVDRLLDESHARTSK